MQSVFESLCQTAVYSQKTLNLAKPFSQALSMMGHDPRDHEADHLATDQPSLCSHISMLAFSAAFSGEMAGHFLLAAKRGHQTANIQNTEREKRF